MQAPKTHFEQIPVAIVKKIVEGLPTEKEQGTDWREFAQRVQVETDSNQMIHLVQQLIEKFDEEQLRKGQVNTERGTEKLD